MKSKLLSAAIITYQVVSAFVAVSNANAQVVLPPGVSPDEAKEFCLYYLHETGPYYREAYEQCRAKARNIGEEMACILIYAGIADSTAVWCDDFLSELRRGDK